MTNKLPATRHFSMSGLQAEALIAKAIELGRKWGQGEINRQQHARLLWGIREDVEKHETVHFNLSTPAGRKKAQQHFATH